MGLFGLQGTGGVGGVGKHMHRVGGGTERERLRV